MSSDSVEEDELIVPLLFEDSDDYMERCDNEANNLVPILDRLCIYDDELMNVAGVSMNAIPSSINSFEENPKAYSNGKSSPIFFGDLLSNICVSEAIKAAVDCTKSIFGIEETSEVVSTNTKSDIQFEDITQRESAGGETYMHSIDTKEEKILQETKEIVDESFCEESPLDLTLKPILEDNDETESCSAASENVIEPAPEKNKVFNLETGELRENSNLLSNTTSSVNMEHSYGKMLLDQYVDEMAKSVSLDLDSSRLSYSADISSDDQSHKTSEIAIDYPPDTPNFAAANAVSSEDKLSSKSTDFFPSTSGMSEMRQRRFGVFQLPSSIADSTEISKTQSSSDEDSKISKSVRKDTLVNSRRKPRKTPKLSPRPIAQISSNSPCKRKNTSENSAKVSGKFRKRSISEHNLETGEKSHLIIRSRSLSSSKKIDHSELVTKPSDNSNTLPSRKRTLSES